MDLPGQVNFTPVRVMRSAGRDQAVAENRTVALLEEEFQGQWN